jgi:hypothetical protein
MTEASRFLRLLVRKSRMASIIIEKWAGAHRSMVSWSYMTRWNTRCSSFGIPSTNVDPKRKTSGAEVPFGTMHSRFVWNMAWSLP